VEMPFCGTAPLLLLGLLLHAAHSININGCL
jgi:hypothetical protein